MTSRLRMGVIGLGHRWERYRTALMALRGDVQVVALTDPNLHRAQHEAQHLGCRAVEGVLALLEESVDAVLVTGGAWYGYWAVEQACKANKPVLCAISPIEDEEHIDGVRVRLGDTKNVHMALWPTLLLLTEVLTDRTEQSLGRPHLLHAHWNRQGEESQPVLWSSSTLALLHAASILFESDPLAISSQTIPHRPGFASLVMEFPNEAIGQISLWGGPSAISSCQLHVEADAGRALVELPRKVEWHDEGGRHLHHLPSGPAEAIVLDRFILAVRHEEPPECSLAKACRVLDWVRAARQGGRIELTPMEAKLEK